MGFPGSRPQRRGLRRGGRDPLPERRAVPARPPPGERRPLPGLPRGPPRGEGREKDGEAPRPPAPRLRPPERRPARGGEAEALPGRDGGAPLEARLPPEGGGLGEDLGARGPLRVLLQGRRGHALERGGTPLPRAPGPPPRGRPVQGPRPRKAGGRARWPRPPWLPRERGALPPQGARGGRKALPPGGRGGALPLRLRRRDPPTRPPPLPRSGRRSGRPPERGEARGSRPEDLAEQGRGGPRIGGAA